MAHDNSKRPLPIIPGHEVSGIVDAVTPSVDGLSVGDEVFGLIDFQRDGADAEFVAARATELAVKPATLDFIQAAAVPVAALTAWQALFDHGQLRRGEKVLIHGASDGIRSFAIQLAHWAGAEVPGTSCARNAGLVKDLGADTVIDYKATKFDEAVQDMDLVFDTVGGETWERSWGVLRPGGRLVSVAVPKPPDREPENGVTAIWFVVEQNHSELSEISHIIDEGHLHPVVSRILPLSQWAPA